MPNPSAIVTVSTDEWVIIENTADAWLYTRDLVGCIGLVVETKEQVGLAHVLDRDGAGNTDSAAMRHELDLVAAVMTQKAPLIAAWIIQNSTSGPRNTPTRIAVKDWVTTVLAERYVETAIGNNVLVEPKAQGYSERIGPTTLDDAQRLLLKNPAAGRAWVSHWGKLPQWTGHVE